MYSDYIRGKLYEESQIPRGQQYWMYYFQFITLYTSLIIICAKWESLAFKDILTIELSIHEKYYEIIYYIE